MKKYVALSMLVAGLLIGCGGSGKNNTKTQANNNSVTTSDNSSQNTQTSDNSNTTVNPDVSSSKSDFKFTKEWLDNTTIYAVAESEKCKESGGTKCFFVGVTTFKNNELYIYKHDESEKNFKVSYTLNEDKGYLIVKNKNGETRYISVAGEKTADYIPINWSQNVNGGVSDYWYFDLEKAKARAEAENSK